MRDDYSYQTQTSLSKAEQSERKEDDSSDLGNGSTFSEQADTEMKFLSVMSQYEMEILTTLFPKCAQTLAGVLRNRPQQFEEEL